MKTFARNCQAHELNVNIHLQMHMHKRNVLTFTPERIYNRNHAKKLIL